MTLKCYSGSLTHFLSGGKSDQLRNSNKRGNFVEAASKTGQMRRRGPGIHVVDGVGRAMSPQLSGSCFGKWVCVLYEPSTACMSSLVFVIFFGSPFGIPPVVRDSRVGVISGKGGC